MSHATVTRDIRKMSRPHTEEQKYRGTDVSFATRTSAAGASFGPTGQEVAAWWYACSPAPTRVDAGIAAKRFAIYAGRCDPFALWLALGELAAEGHPARYFTERVARERIARIRETLREIEKAEERVVPLRPRGMRSIAAILGAA